MPSGPTPLQPEKNPNRGFRTWLQNQIYTGASGPGSYVPNVDDMVLSWTTGFGRVVSVDPITNLSIIDDVNFAQGSTVSEVALFNAGPGTPSGAFCVYINASQIPISLNVHALWRTYSLDASYAKIFKGTNIGTTGHVISAVLDGAGNVISENLPMQNIVLPGATNLGCKTVGAGYSIEALNDGDIVTLVVYNASGATLRVDRLPIVNTGFVRSLDASKKYVTGIELISDYLNVSNPAQIDYPVNMTLQSGMFQGRVHYSDGSVITLPVDGTQFSLYGINSFIPTQLDQVVSVVLDYTLSANEYGYNLSVPTPNRHFSKSYTLKVVSADGAYGLRLYPVAVWDQANTKYKLNYYLYSLTRDAIYDVSSYVSSINGSPAFNGTAWNVTQQLTVSFNMANLGTSFQPYVYLETFRVLLKAPAVSGAAAEYLGITSNLSGAINTSTQARYVVDDSDSSKHNLYLDNNIGQLSEWLDQFYFSETPLRFGGVEFAAPTPTHVRLVIGTEFAQIVPIAMVMTGIMDVAITNAQGKTLRMEFISYNGSNVIELGCNHLIIKAV